MLLIYQPVKPHATQGDCQRQFSKVSYRNIYSDIICICTGMFSLLVNSEQQRWQTWSRTHVDICQCHLSQLVPGPSEWRLVWVTYLILFTCLSNWPFRSLKKFGWYWFWEKWNFFLHVYIWIDLGAGAPVIDLALRLRQLPPANVCQDLATEPFQFWNCTSIPKFELTHDCN